MCGFSTTFSCRSAIYSTTLQEANKFTRPKFRWVNFKLWTNLSCRCNSAALIERQCRRWIWLLFKLNFYRHIHSLLDIAEILQKQAPWCCTFVLRTMWMAHSNTKHDPNANRTWWHLICSMYKWMKPITQLIQTNVNIYMVHETWLIGWYALVHRTLPVISDLHR